MDILARYWQKYGTKNMPLKFMSKILEKAKVWDMAVKIWEGSGSWRVNHKTKI